MILILETSYFIINHNIVILTNAAAAAMNVTGESNDKYDWRRRLSRINMTDFDLAKCDWRRRLGGGGADH